MGHLISVHLDKHLHTGHLSLRNEAAKDPQWVFYINSYPMKLTIHRCEILVKVYDASRVCVCFITCTSYNQLTRLQKIEAVPKNSEKVVKPICIAYTSQARLIQLVSMDD